MFEIGDVVRIKSDADKIFTGVHFAVGMKKYLGKEAIIKSFNERTCTYILENVVSKQGFDWNFSEEWLERSEQTKEIKIEESDFNYLLCLK